MKMKFKILILIIAVLLALSAAVFFYATASGAIGISKRQLEKEAQVYYANESWKIFRSAGDTLYIQLLHNEALDDHEYSIYVNRDGFSFGYFLVQGGSDAKIKDDVAMFEFEGELILISLNRVGVAQIHHDGVQYSRQSYKNPAEPFIETFPADPSGTLTMYDSDGEIIPLDVGKS